MYRELKSSSAWVVHDIFSCVESFNIVLGMCTFYPFTNSLSVLGFRMLAVVSDHTIYICILFEFISHEKVSFHRKRYYYYFVNKCLFSFVWIRFAFYKIMVFFGTCIFFIIKFCCFPLFEAWTSAPIFHFHIGPFYETSIELYYFPSRIGRVIQIIEGNQRWGVGLEGQFPL